MFRAHVLIVTRSKLYYTTSGIVTPVGGHPVHMLREESSLNLCTGQLSTQCDDTRGCIVKFWRPDDEHMCSKHVET